jgi:hypothetical protein
MARPTFDRNPKTMLAQARLGISRALFRGIVELIWDAANESGNPIFSCPEAVEAVTEWGGEPGRLVAILTEKGSNFLDVRDDGQLEIHDYWDHAPRYVKNRLYQENHRKKTKELVNDSKQTSADSQRDVSNRKHSPSTQHP